MTGTELTSRLLTDIARSLELRARIPYLDMLKELAEGGAALSAAVLNTSSNFGSFDHYLSEVLVLLHQAQRVIIAPAYLPLPLVAIQTNLSTHAAALAQIFQQEIDQPNAPAVYLYRLNLINAASV